MTCAMVGSWAQPTPAFPIFTTPTNQALHSHHPPCRRRDPVPRRWHKPCRCCSASRCTGPHSSPGYPPRREHSTPESWLCCPRDPLSTKHMWDHSWEPQKDLGMLHLAVLNGHRVKGTGAGVGAKARGCTPTSMLELKALFTLALMLTTCPTLKNREERRESRWELSRGCGYPALYWHWLGAH